MRVSDEQFVALVRTFRNKEAFHQAGAKIFETEQKKSTELADAWGRAADMLEGLEVPPEVVG